MDGVNTKNDLIVLPIGKILIIRKNEKKEFFKLNEDNTLVELNEEERKYIDNIFYPLMETSIDYESAWEIAKNNNVFQDQPLLWEKIIAAIDKMIPESAKDNFKRNLQTLKMEIIEEKIGKGSGILRSASYRVDENKIVIRKEYIEYIKELEEDGIIENATLEILRAKIHELIHMASSQYDKENGIFKSGFDEWKKDEVLKTSNRGLTEGITEVMTRLVMNNVFGPNTVSLEDSGYKKEALIAKQLLMLGTEKLREQYFKGNGIQEIKDSLKDYYKFDEEWENQVEILFERIEEGYLLRKVEDEECFKSTIPASVQFYLLSALESKIGKDIENGILKSVDDVEEYMGIYAKNLLTPENLELDENEQKKFPRLQEVYERFEIIKNTNKEKIILREKWEEEKKKYLEEIEREKEENAQETLKDEKLNNTENKLQGNEIAENNITLEQIEKATEDISISSINNEEISVEKVIGVPNMDASEIE